MISSRAARPNLDDSVGHLLSLGLTQLSIQVTLSTSQTMLRAQIAASLVDVLAFNARAADVAGALRCAHAHAAAGRQGSKTSFQANDRVAWIIDLQPSSAFWHRARQR